MMRRTAALGLLLAACSGGTADTTVPVPEPRTTSTTKVVESTTTTEAVEPVDICPRGVAWEPGTTYAADCFLVPVAFMVDEEGWGSEGAGDDWMKVRWLAPADQGFRVRVALVAAGSTRSPAAVLDRIASHGSISEVSDRMEVSVGGVEGLAVDAEGAAEEGGERPGSGGCTGDSPVWFEPTRFGHALFPTPWGDVGVGACQVARIVVVQAGDLTVLAIGGTTDQDRHEEAVAKIESLFEGMSFDTGGGS